MVTPQLVCGTCGLPGRVHKNRIILTCSHSWNEAGIKRLWCETCGNYTTPDDADDGICSTCSKPYGQDSDDN
jgi:hypothetical protein